MDEKIVKAAETAVAEAIKSDKRVEIVPLKNDIKINIVERKEVKIPS